LMMRWVGMAEAIPLTKHPGTIRYVAQQQRPGI
jgi:hypothetical protein